MEKGGFTSWEKSNRLQMGIHEEKGQKWEDRQIQSKASRTGIFTEAGN